MEFYKKFLCIVYVSFLLVGHGFCQDRSVIDRSVIDIIRESRDLTEVS